MKKHIALGCTVIVGVITITFVLWCFFRGVFAPSTHPEEAHVFITITIVEVSQTSILAEYTKSGTTTYYSIPKSSSYYLRNSNGEQISFQMLDSGNQITVEFDGVVYHTSPETFQTIYSITLEK